MSTIDLVQHFNASDVVDIRIRSINATRRSVSTVDDCVDRKSFACAVILVEHFLLLGETNVCVNLRNGSSEKKVIR